jgi:hypothetical protein
MYSFGQEIEFDDTLSGKHKTLCCTFMMFVEGTGNREQCLLVVACQQFADHTANTVVEGRLVP